MDVNRGTRVQIHMIDVYKLRNLSRLGCLVPTYFGFDHDQQTLEVRLQCSIKTFGLPMVAKQALLHISQALRLFEDF